MYKDCVNQGEGFVRLTTEQLRGNLLDVLERVMFAGERVVLQQAGSEVAAIIPIGEFERLEYVHYEMKSFPISDATRTQYQPHEYEYYEYAGGIHCIDSDELQAEFEEILKQVMLDNEIFGVLTPTKLSGHEFDTFTPIAILMNINKFWVPEYLISERNRLMQRN